MNIGAANGIQGQPCKPILKLFENSFSSYIWRTPDVIVTSSNEEVTQKIHNLVQKLNAAITQQQILDNKRSRIKIATLTPFLRGSALQWRNAVNDLNNQKKLVASHAEQIMFVIQNNVNAGHLKIVYNTDEGRIDAADEYLADKGKKLFSFFNEGRVQITLR